MQDKQRLVLLVIFGVIILLTYHFVQGLYDSADERKAIKIVKSYPQYGSPTLVQLIEERHEGKQNGAFEWSSEVTDSMFGHVMVHVNVPLQNRQFAKYEFGVNLTTVSLHPANKNAEEVLKLFDQIHKKPSKE